MTTHHPCKFGTWHDFENPGPAFILSPRGISKEKRNQLSELQMPK